MITRRHVLAGLVTVPFVAKPAFAGCAPVFSEGGIAIRGIDPVSYFRAGRPVAGHDTYRLMWRNAIWRFADLQSMGMFERDPRRFAPRYGGYCAMSLSLGAVVQTVPDAWAIYQGRLYLTRSQTIRDQWQTDPESYIAKADAYWPKAVCG